MTAQKRKAKARDDGDGSVFPLGDGAWRAQLTIWVVDPATGKKVRRYKRRDRASKADAKAALRELIRQRDTGELPIGEQVTVEAWMTYWLEHIAPRRCVVKTLEGYAGQVRHWIIPTIGDIPLRELQPEHVEYLHDAMYAGKPWTRSNGKAVPARPLAPTTVLQAHRVLSRALTVAMQRGKVHRNVAQLVDPPPIGEASGRVKYLSVDDARTVLATCAGRWNDALWSVGLAIGLRPGERLGLLWDEDVDLAAETVTVQRQLQRRRGGTLELVPYVKSRAGHRTVALPPPLVAALRAHRKRQIEMRLAIGDEWVGSTLGDLVFTDPRGRAIDPRRDWQSWKTLLAEAGVPYVRPHGSRHTAASLMLLQKVDIKVVQVILGHGSSTITRDLYQHVAPELARDAAAVVGAALWGDSVSHTVSHGSGRGRT